MVKAGPLVAVAPRGSDERVSGPWDCVAGSASALVGRARGFGGVDRGCPAAEELQRLLGAGAGLGGVGEERQPGVSGEVQPVEAQA